MYNEGMSRKAAISGSAAFADKFAEFEQKLTEQGIEVVACPRSIDAGSDEQFYQAYSHFHAVLNQANELYLMNYDKKGIRGYIGYAGFAELVRMLARKMAGESVNIYLYQIPDETCGCYDEIKRFLDLNLIELYKGE